MIRTTLWVGSVFVAPLGDEVHDLLLDLTGDRDFRLFVDTAREFLPLKNYLAKHPERRTEVLSILKQRMR